MTKQFMQNLLDSGEGYTIEYKKSQNKLSSDVFETVSSFSNRYGGHILLGITEEEYNGRKIGNVIGVNKDCIYDIKRDFINILNNPTKFKPTLYLELEEFDYDGKTILWTYVPPLSQLCYCDNKVFDRNNDADQNITDKNDRIADIITRKSTDYREQQILPYANESHLKMELFDRVRKMVRSRDKDHPWQNMDDMEIMRSAGLYVENIVTGKSGFNLAAILLFGRPEVIKSCVPGYKTDAIYRVTNTDRYDDRDIVEDNLIEAYSRLMSFCLKHLDNRFVLDGDVSIDARELIAREVISNILIHRDYSSAYPAKLIIEKNVLRTENWSKSRFNGPLNIDTFSPYPKNPLLAGFFVNIGLADTLGSGMRNLMKYTQLYSHANPILSEGDIFKTSIPLLSNDDANPDANEANNEANNAKFDANDANITNSDANDANPKDKDETVTAIVLEKIAEQPYITQSKLSELAGVSRSTIQRITKALSEQGKLERIGGTRGYWEVKGRNSI